MTRSPTPFKQADVVRFIKAARRAGTEVLRAEIGTDGKITFIMSGAANAAENDMGELEEFRRANGYS